MITLREALALKQKFYGSVYITPPEAKRCIEEHVNVRNVVQSHVDYFTFLIKSGEWLPEHPQPIVFDHLNILLDGQHRLYGVYEADIPVIANIATKVDRNVYEPHIDDLMARKLPDRVKIAPSHNKVTVQTLSFLLQLARPGTKYKKASPTQILDCNQAYGEAVQAVCSRIVTYQRGITRVGTLAALALCYNHDPIKAIPFIDSVVREEGPVQQGRKVRNWLLTSCPGAGGTGASLNIVERVYYAFSYWLAGEEVNSLHRFEEIKDVSSHIKRKQTKN